MINESNRRDNGGTGLCRREVIIRKRVIAVMAALLLLCSIMASQTVSAQALSIKKIVSVVFDDSGSMNDASKKWVYANYAMQTFAGLLNKEDELFIIAVLVQKNSG